MAAPETLRARQAALLLHGLPAAVRQQVLARLSAPEALRLRPLLDELSALGIPTTRVASIEEPRSAVERAKQLRPEAVLQALRHRPPETVALLLRAVDWPWKREVINGMPDALRREVVNRANGDVATAPAVLRILSECLCRDAVAPPIYGAADTPVREIGRASCRERV